MSRNSSGTYTLPIAPYQPGTVISSSDMNTNLNDIALALTQSLATTGVSTMTGPVRLADGAAASPSLTTGSDSGTGWYYSNTYEWTFVANGAAKFTIGSSAFNFTTDGNFTGNVTFQGTVTITGTLGITTLNTTSLIVRAQSTPTAPSGGSSPILIYNEGINYSGPSLAQNLFGIDSSGNISPLMFRGGQCRLTLNGTSLRLDPYMGNMLTIAGVPREVPSAGITLAASNTAATFVYIYAYMSAPTTMALEMSTTVPVDVARFGIKAKTGDLTRTLVGAAYTDAGGAWANTTGKLWVLSYFNRVNRISKLAPNIGASWNTYVSNGAVGELNTQYRNQFITWSDEPVLSAVVMNAYCSGANYQNPLIINVDGVTSSNTAMIQAYYPNGVAAQQIINGKVSNVTENANHYASIYVLASSGIQYGGGGDAGAGPNTTFILNSRG